MKLGVMGAGIAASMASFAILVCGYFLMRYAKDLDKAIQIQVTDPRVLSWPEF